MTFPDSDERRVLIQQTEAIKNLCRSFDEFKEDNKQEHKNIKDKLEALADSKVSFPLFFFTILIIIGFLSGLVVYTGELKNNVVKNETKIQQIQKVQDNRENKDINNLNFRNVK